MAPPTLFEKAESDRESIRDHLDLLDDELRQHRVAALDRTQLEHYLEEAAELKTQLMENHRNLRSVAAKTTDMNPYKLDFQDLSKRISRIHSSLHGIVMAFPPPATPTASTSAAAATTHHSIKLPPLELPKFSGNLQEWVSFRDMFLTAVHNSTLTKVEKLTQLKALLTGEAARQVRSLILCDANYDIAWQSLKDRYENNRELLFSILKRMTTQSVITSITATNLRSLIDTTKECVRSLEVLAIPTQHWDAIIIFILFSKLDASSRELWEQSLQDTSIPPLSKLYEFLEQRARALAASNVQPPRQQAKPPQQQVRAHHVSTSTCRLGCNAAHPYFRCPLFKEQSPQQRLDTVKRFHLCQNCLIEGHIAATCSSLHTCKVCNNKHHTMLHLDSGRQHQQSTQQTRTQTTESAQQSASGISNHHINHQNLPELKTGILSTARVKVITSNGEDERRVFLDSGGTNCTITKRAAKKMNLPLRRMDIPMTGLADAYLGTAKYITSFTFTSRFNPLLTFSATAVVVKSINTSIPSEKLKREEWHHINGLDLADPCFDKPDQVDILLGTDVFWSILGFEKKIGAPGQPLAIKTALGWIVAGANIATAPVTIFNINADINFDLQRFWDQETVSEESHLSTEEKACEEHFASTHKRDSSGRFIVTLPFKDEPKPSSLGASRQAAVKRFLSLERKFTNHTSIRDTEKIRKLTDQWKQYIDFMQEYEQLGHMSPVPPNELQSSVPTYYIPHHSVLKESSTTTKLRVVFDASAPTSTGIALNDCLMVGPKLQDNITAIQLRFRTHKIVFTADITKMYRQILVAPGDRSYQRIIWRSHPSLPLTEYNLCTLTYGTAPAAYLAVKCLQQLARDEERRFPEAAKILLTDFYMDDNASGCSTVEEAKQTVQQLIDLCMSGGFELRKWTSNSNELLNCIPEQLRETNSLIQLQEDTTIKTLGVFWNPAEDKYLFRLALPPDMPGMYTKRNILSDIAKIYDPLGWLTPAIIVCKQFMQELWKNSSDWDDVLPPALQSKWQEIKTSLKDLEKIEIPRCVCHHPVLRRYLFGCSDASTRAISAAVYLYNEYENNDTSCALLTSKTRVAPVKAVTLPRLELNGAVLLSELLATTQRDLHFQFDAIRAFTDSTITLHWVTSSPTRWKLYVRNRVQTIQNNIPMAEWSHIPGDSNPADCASRGISAMELLHHPLWWTGSSHFHQFNSTADLLEDEIHQLRMEEQAVQLHHLQPQPLHRLFTNYSNFGKLQRVVAFILRFVNNSSCRRQCSPIQLGSLTVSELNNAHTIIICQLQKVSFPLEYQALSEGRAIPNSSSLRKLKPYIASDKLLRVGGRLENSVQPYSRKHPVLLPRSHHITTSIIRDLHLQLLHAGPTATLAALQQRYWVTNGRDTTRMVLRRCVSCARHRADLMKQVMGDLPRDRVSPAPPFSKVGVDYAGPLLLRPMVRSKVTLKCWLAVFVCFTTKAIHIEVVSSLTTECFLAALRRFMSRRGKPTDIYSDCGTNFKGSDKVLTDFLKLSKQQPVVDECSSQRINWHFNPAGAPHFGGLWEAGVKSIKHHLKRVIGSSHLTYEEMNSLVVQIEGILNSRPIVPASSDPGDLEALTPAHFLIGGPITALPEPDLLNVKESHLKRWQLLQQRKQLFWKRWTNEYLTRLQQRPKWLKPSPNLEVDQLVIIKDERLPPLKWKLGRVVAVHPGADGHVRVATLRTSEGEIKRPV